MTMRPNYTELTRLQKHVLIFGHKTP